MLFYRAASNARLQLLEHKKMPVNMEMLMQVGQSEIHKLQFAQSVLQQEPRPGERSSRRYCG
ncbi:MAG: hypothetical protein ACYS19_05690 [Planctomycetota bacterium]|jgi:hypothetical protein